ncbi:AraC family ligand binding domain-containing protein [Nonomuraea thailandensis]
MDEPPVDRVGAQLHFTEGTVAYAGHFLHERRHPVHTHSFIEVVMVTGGEGVHVSLAGRRPLAVGDVILLRPGSGTATRTAGGSTCTTAASPASCCGTSWPGPVRIPCSTTCSGPGPTRCSAAGC